MVDQSTLLYKEESKKKNILLCPTVLFLLVVLNWLVSTLAARSYNVTTYGLTLSRPWSSPLAKSTCGRLWLPNRIPFLLLSCWMHSVWTTKRKLDILPCLFLFQVYSKQRKSNPLWLEVTRRGSPIAARWLLSCPDFTLMKGAETVINPNFSQETLENRPSTMYQLQLSY